MSLEKSVNRICPVGSTSMFPKNDPSIGALGGPSTGDRFLPSHSKKTEGGFPKPGLAIINTLSFGSHEAGPSAMLRSVMPLTTGKTGPAVHLPVYEL